MVLQNLLYVGTTTQRFRLKNIPLVRYNQCSQIGLFLKDAVTIFLLKVVFIVGYSWSPFKKCHLLSKIYCDSATFCVFLATSGHTGYETTGLEKLNR